MVKDTEFEGIDISLKDKNILNVMGLDINPLNEKIESLNNSFNMNEVRLEQITGDIDLLKQKYNPTVISVVGEYNINGINNAIEHKNHQMVNRRLLTDEGKINYHNDFNVLIKNDKNENISYEQLLIPKIHREQHVLQISSSEKIKTFDNVKLGLTSIIKTENLVTDLDKTVTSYNEFGNIRKVLKSLVLDRISKVNTDPSDKILKTNTSIDSLLGVIQRLANLIRAVGYKKAFKDCTFTTLNKYNFNNIVVNAVPTDPEQASIYLNNIAKTDNAIYSIGKNKKSSVLAAIFFASPGDILIPMFGNKVARCFGYDKAAYLGTINVYTDDVNSFNTMLKNFNDTSIFFDEENVISLLEYISDIFHKDTFYKLLNDFIALQSIASTMDDSNYKVYPISVPSYLGLYEVEDNDLKSSNWFNIVTINKTMNLLFNGNYFQQLINNLVITTLQNSIPNTNITNNNVMKNNLKIIIDRLIANFYDSKYLLNLVNSIYKLEIVNCTEIINEQLRYLYSSIKLNKKYSTYCSLQLPINHSILPLLNIGPKYIQNNISEVLTGQTKLSITSVNGSTSVKKKEEYEWLLNLSINDIQRNNKIKDYNTKLYFLTGIIDGNLSQNLGSKTVYSLDINFYVNYIYSNTFLDKYHLDDDDDGVDFNLEEENKKFEIKNFDFEVIEDSFYNDVIETNTKKGFVQLHKDIASRINRNIDKVEDSLETEIDVKTFTKNLNLRIANSKPDFILNYNSTLFKNLRRLNKKLGIGEDDNCNFELEVKELSNKLKPYNSMVLKELFELLFELTKRIQLTPK